MCNFPASPSTPPADKCCVIPTTNFRRKKLNWKSIHFESGRQSTHPAASIWLNSHFSTFSVAALEHLGQNCSHEPKWERASASCKAALVFNNESLTFLQRSKIPLVFYNEYLKDPREVCLSTGANCSAFLLQTVLKEFFCDKL